MPRTKLGAAVFAVSLGASATGIGIASCDSGDATPTGVETVQPTGCTPAGGAARPPTAPDGYYVNGNTVCTAEGKPHLFHGVDRPSLEWSPTGQNLSAADFTAMAGWHANVVRVALNQDFWLPGSPQFSSGYAALVDDVVHWAEAAGLDVILDLHWSDRGDFSVMPGQQPMADQHSIAFWTDVAGRYQSDGRVIFELYNEPHDVPGSVWLSGGMSQGYLVAGMQQLHDAVRATGAENLVIIGGLDYAYDLSVVAEYPVVGHNIVYATHPYNNAGDRQPSTWLPDWGYLTVTNPVVVTEFGDGTGSCSSAWDTELIAYADARNAGWTSWAWFAGDCKFPALLTDWNGGTTNEGKVVMAALLGYGDPAPPRAGADGGSDSGVDASSNGGDDGGDDGPG